MNNSLALAAATLAAAPVSAANAAETVIEEITVTSQLRETTLADVPASVTALDSATIESAGLQHFEELTQLVPNLNWSGEGARARYFQLRGTGELEQYEGAPNPSVGFIIDDIDFSGLGGAGTLFDAERIEVLRGPQGTRYGANALAGLVYFQSVAPGFEPEAWVEATGGNADTLAVGGAAGGALPGTGDTLAWRLSGNLYRNNGFRDNVFLGRDDTYERDELTARARLRWVPNDDWRVDFTGLYVDLDNGYDAFAIDNGFTTYSDKPGRDAQQTLAGSLRVEGDLNAALRLVSITALADSDIDFSFDADWGNDDFWNQPQFGNSTYDYTSQNLRDRRTLTQEFRLLSNEQGRLFDRADWLLGVFVQQLDEDIERLDLGRDSGFFCPDPCTTTVASGFEATSVALFGQLDVPLTERLDLTAGLRVERREAEYAEDFGFATTGFEFDVQNAFEPTDRLWGGELALNYRWTDRAQLYGRVARGYKAGGFNVGLARADLGAPGAILGSEDIPYDKEALWNVELGLRRSSDDGRWNVDLAVFWQQRDDMQVKIPFQVQPGDPNTFLFLTANAEQGRALGAELAGSWQALDSLRLDASLGLLQTEVREFSFLDRLLGEPGFESLQGLVGRDFAHAPRYSYSIAANWSGPSGIDARAELWGRDRFYFDFGHNERSSAYNVVNLSLGKTWRQLSVTAWVRNAFDETYAVRGFFFGNEPPGFPNRLYLRLADPRQYGVTLQYRFGG